MVQHIVREIQDNPPSSPLIQQDFLIQNYRRSTGTRCLFHAYRRRLAEARLRVIHHKSHPHRNPDIRSFTITPNTGQGVKSRTQKQHSIKHWVGTFCHSKYSDLRWEAHLPKRHISPQQKYDISSFASDCIRSANRTTQWGFLTTVFSQFWSRKGQQ